MTDRPPPSTRPAADHPRQPPEQATARLSRRRFLAGSAALGAVAVGAGALVAGGCSSGDDAPGTTEETGGEEPTTSAGPPATSTGAPAAFVARGGDAAEVALTFHTNGDLGVARRLLDVVEDHGAPITCFVIGSWLDANPSWGARLRDGGHELANHTYTHPNFGALGPEAMVDEIRRCRDALRRHAGDGGRFFRPSGTDDGTVDPGPEVAAAAGLAGYPLVAGFDVDPYDYRDPGAATVTSRTLAAVRPGSIVSLHFGHPGTVVALPDILEGLSAQGLTPVTLSRLVG